MKLIGLTGGIATGKSMVAKMFRKLSVPIINADEIAHRVIKKGKPAYKKLLLICGKTILKKNGEINRARLAELIFSDMPWRVRIRKKVEKTIHLEVWKAIKKIVQPFKSLSGLNDLVVIEVPLLFEAEWNKKVDYTIVVTCKPNQQKRRCRYDFINRIKFQMPLAKKVQLADFIIDNSGGRKKTAKQVRSLVRLFDNPHNWRYGRMLTWQK